MLPYPSVAMPKRLLPLTFLALFAAAGPAQAGLVVLTSKAPYWKVGARDDELSLECSLDQFSPLHPGELVARFVGPQGTALLDVAKGSGLNLRDPKHLARPNEDYFFRNVGTTSCEVLVGGRHTVKKPAAAAKAPPAKATPAR
jgi:hypothetical protein